MIKARIEELRTRTTKLVARRDFLIEQRDQVSKNLTAHEALNENLMAVQSVLSKLSEDRQKETLEFINGLLTYGLTTVFEKPLRFEFQLASRGREQTVKTTIHTETGPTDVFAHGGGLLNVASFLIRTVVFVTVAAKNEKFIVLDEPFAQLSASYHQNICELVKELSNRFEIKYLIVSHQPLLSAVADREYRLVATEDGTTIEEVSR
jgi:DNA repair exonuclease SbcCD ATPase subunit